MVAVKRIVREMSLFILVNEINYYYFVLPKLIYLYFKYTPENQ